MPRSATVWAAALVLTSFSAYGPMLTTAEAMPAPEPQRTQMRPRYYFPRHVKRQIVTNTTAPASPTPVSATTDSSDRSAQEHLETRQLDFTSFVDSLFSSGHDESSSSSSDANVQKSDFNPTSPGSSTIIVSTTTAPDGSASGTGNAQELLTSATLSSSQVDEPTSSATPSSFSVDSSSSTPSRPAESNPPRDSAVGSSTGIPSIIVKPTTSSEPIDVPSPTSKPLPGPSHGLPDIIVPASSTLRSSDAASSDVTSATATATPSDEPVDGLLPSLLGPIIAPTGTIPSSVVQPTLSTTGDVPSSSASSDGSGQGVGSTGSLPDVIVTPTPVSSASAAPSSSDTSSFLGPFIVSGTGTGGVSPPTVQPTTSSRGLLPSLLASLEPSSTATPEAGSTGLLPVNPVLPTSTGTASADPLSLPPLISLPTTGTGIMIGITTAFGTGNSPVPTPTAPPLSSGAIPASESVSASSTLSDMPSILSSVLSEQPGIGPSSLGPTAPAPTGSSVGVLPPASSSLVPSLSGLFSSAASGVPASALPTASSSIISGAGSLLPSASTSLIAPSDIPSSLVPSGVLPSSGAVPTGTLPSSGAVPTGTLPSSGVLPPSGTLPTGSVFSSAVAPPSATIPTPSETASINSSLASSTIGITPSAGISPSGSTAPSGSVGSSVAPIPTSSGSESRSIPASEGPSSTSSSGTPSSETIIPPTSGNATISNVPTSTAAPSSSIGSNKSDSAFIPISTIPSTTVKPSPVISLSATATDSATSLVVGTSIVQEASSPPTPTATATANGIPSSLPHMIAPPGGMPSQVAKDTFMGQVCFKWPLNYPFVSANDGGQQIFLYLSKAIAHSLNISQSKVQNFGLKPLDTTQYQGFITTLALFTIPSDLQSKLAAQLRNPADSFWNNPDSTVNDLTSLINTACPLPAGQVPGQNSLSNDASGDPASTSNGGGSDGGAMGGDIGASRKVNSTSAIVASSAIVGAIAYGAAMFFVARRYRNKRMAHQRSSSVPSTSRMTYGSIPGGAAAWMHGARNGRITPASRGSQGSSTSQGRSVRTQQISAPVMAENSLGWN